MSKVLRLEKGDKVVVMDPENRCVVNILNRRGNTDYFVCRTIEGNEIYVHELHLKLYKKLSGRELQILLGIKEGLKNKILASVNGLNEKTISTYKFRVKSKLGLSNDDNDYLLVITAIKLGIID